MGNSSSQRNIPPQRVNNYSNRSTYGAPQTINAERNFMFDVFQQLENSRTIEEEHRTIEVEHRTISSNSFPNVRGRGRGRGRGGNRGGGRSENQGVRSDNDDDLKRVFRIPTGDVTMPTGLVVSVTIPSKPRCTCKALSNPVLIPLGPKSRRPSPDYQIIVDQMNSTIRQHTSGSYSKYNIVSLHKVKNCCLWTKFRNRQLDMAKEGIDINERMMFHGSSATEDIMKMGFDERHSNESGMFGAGIYFAEHSSKSNQYVFGYMGGNGCKDHRNPSCTLCLRKLLLCRVTLGQTMQMASANKMSHAPPGYHSVVGQPTLFGLQYPEYVIYRGEQAYPEYLITYRIVL